MPEGHLVHRAARAQHEDLAGRAASFPQDRRLDTTPVDGRTLDRVQAHGKALRGVGRSGAEALGFAAVGYLTLGRELGQVVIDAGAPDER